MTFIHLDIFFDPAELTEFRLHADAFGMSTVNYSLADGDILRKRSMAGVDHDRAVKPGVDAIVTGFLVTVIEMDRENSFRKNGFRSANHRFQHPFIRVTARAFR